MSLRGGWSVGHYGGDEGFFGWLALQTVAHRMCMSDLTEDETAALGPNLQRLERVLRSAAARGLSGTEGTPPLSQ